MLASEQSRLGLVCIDLLTLVSESLFTLYFPNYLRLLLKDGPSFAVITFFVSLFHFSSVLTVKECFLTSVREHWTVSPCLPGAALFWLFQFLLSFWNGPSWSFLSGICGPVLGPPLLLCLSSTVSVEFTGTYIRQFVAATLSFFNDFVMMLSIKSSKCRGSLIRFLNSKFVLCIQYAFCNFYDISNSPHWNRYVRYRTKNMQQFMYNWMRAMALIL